MNLLDQLKIDEGCKLEVYLDTKGIRTGGYGHNLEAHGIDLPVGAPITQEQADKWLLQDASSASRIVDGHLSWARGLDTPRHDVLTNMCFNMGWGDGTHGLSSFHRMLAMVEAGNYAGAAEAMLESKWAKEVHERARRLSMQMEHGEASEGLQENLRTLGRSENEIKTGTIDVPEIEEK